MKFSQVTTNGRITIPFELRKKFGLTPGRRVRFEIAGEGIKLVPLVTAEEIKANIGFLGIKGKSLLKALMEEKKTEREL